MVTLQQLGLLLLTRQFRFLAGTPQAACKVSGPPVGARRSGISGAYTAACAPYREGVGSVDLRACRGALLLPLMASRSHHRWEAVPPTALVTSTLSSPSCATPKVGSLDGVARALLRVGFKPCMLPVALLR